jgi:hypothetical protein
MDFNFVQEFNNQQIMESITHLQDALTDFGVESPLAFGVTEDMELEQLQAAETLLKEAVEEALRQEAVQRKRMQIPPCDIGPYADGFCTICGKREP